MKVNGKDDIPANKIHVPNLMTWRVLQEKKPKTIEHAMNYEQVYLKPLLKKWSWLFFGGRWCRDPDKTRFIDIIVYQ